MKKTIAALGLLASLSFAGIAYADNTDVTATPGQNVQAANTINQDPDMQTNPGADLNSQVQANNQTADNSDFDSPDDVSNSDADAEGDAGE